MTNSRYEIIKNHANQWEIWSYESDQKTHLIRVCDWKYEAEKLAKKLNKLSQEEN